LFILCLLVRMDSNHHEDFSQRTLHALWSTHYPSFISYSPPPRQEGLSANFNTYQKVLVDLGSTNKTLREDLPMVELSQKKIITSVRFVSHLLLYTSFKGYHFIHSVRSVIRFQIVTTFYYITPYVYSTLTSSSNPRYLSVKRFSRPPRSTALPLLLIKFFIFNFF
jgi:hypothetical protein